MRIQSGILRKTLDLLAKNSLRKKNIVLTKRFTGQPYARFPGILVPLFFMAAHVPVTLAEELYRTDVTGRAGGWLQTAQRAEPRTFNPISAVDTASKDIIGLINGDLIHINRGSLQTEPALASSWSLSKDGRVYTLNLRRGIHFSDGHPMDADDVVFTFAVHLDEAVGSAQRDLLMVNGKPVIIRKIDSHRVQFELSAPYASAERLFDNVAVLPRHLLWKTWKEGNIARAWGLQTLPDQIAGLGPFRVKSHLPGQRIVLEKNPWFWKADRAGHRLPFLEGIVFEFLPSEDVQTLRLLSGDITVVSPLSSANFTELRKRQNEGRIRAYDAGPGLEYQFLVFNMNKPVNNPGRDVLLKHKWFATESFRQAVSLSIDRDAIVRLAYQGLADPLWGFVTPGNRLWINRKITQKARSTEQARALLKSAGYTWKNGQLLDKEGNAVGFSILVSATNVQRSKMAAIIQSDLRELGMKISVVAMEFRTMLDRVFNRLDYDAAVMAVDGSDVDPNSQTNVWLLGGSMHLWNLSGKAETLWEEEMDRLMRRQMLVSDRTERKVLYDRVQQLASEHLPFICLTSPHVLVGAAARLNNLQPSILRPNALWNAESLYLGTSN